MKCPKCGYNSFEYLNSCKKCNTSLVAFKETIGLHAGVMPAGAVAATMAAVTAVSGIPASESGSSDANVFQWDLPSTDSSISPPPIEGTEPLHGQSPLTIDEAIESLPPFSFEEQTTTGDSWTVPAVDSGIEEFSFNLHENAQDDIFKTDDGIPSEIKEQSPELSIPANNETFELPGLQDPEILHHDDPATPETANLVLPDEEATSVFGEFSFDESPVSAVTDLENPLSPEGKTDSNSELPFDVFGEIESSGLREESTGNPADSTNEFDLSYLMTDDAPFFTKATHGGADSGDGEIVDEGLESLFGEISEPVKKG